MNLTDLSNDDVVRSIFSLGDKATIPYTENYIGLYLSKSGYYGTYDSTLNLTNVLDRNQTSFTSNNNIEILIEGYVKLNKVPSITGGGAISYKGNGILEVDGTKIYDGRSTGGGTPFSPDMSNNVFNI